MKAKGATPAMDVLDLLGNQLVLDPESLAMLKQEGKVTESEFAALLEAIGDGEVDPEQLLKNAKNAKSTPESLENLLKSENQVIPGTVPVKDGAVEVLETTPKDLVLKQNLENTKPLNPLNEILSKNSSVKLEQAPVKLGPNPIKLEQTQDVKQVLKMDGPVVAEKSETLVSKNPNLMKLSQFMEKQTASTQKRFQASGSYAAPEKSMFIEKVEATNSMAKTGATNAVKAVTHQDLMFAGSDEANLDSSDQNSTQAITNTVKPNTNNLTAESTKTFDMSQLVGDKPMSSEALISKIQDHILQTRAGNEKSIEMSFNHKDLGQVGLHVQKHAGDSIGITISTASAEGAKFFTQNQGELLHSLSSAGIQVSDFKLDSAKAGSNLNQDSSSDSSKQFAGNNKQGAQSESGERKQEQDKRQSLWEQFSEQAAA